MVVPTSVVIVLRLSSSLHDCSDGFIAGDDGQISGGNGQPQEKYDRQTAEEKRG